MPLASLPDQLQKMISVKNLCVSLGGQQILSEISFDLNQEQNLAILGRSGCGKTVLIKTILGLYTPDSGEVIIDGIDMHRGKPEECNDLRRRIAMVFQNAALLDSFTIRQNVALPLYERGETDCEQIQSKVLKSLKLVGLERTLDLLPSQLSGGMRKRAGIARALVYEPDYIIFDEPVSGLDPITAKEVLFYIAQIADSHAATLISITHELKNLESISNRILFLDGGKAIFCGTLPELYENPDEFIKQYLS